MNELKRKYFVNYKMTKCRLNGQKDILSIFSQLLNDKIKYKIINNLYIINSAQSTLTGCPRTEICLYPFDRAMLIQE